VSNIRRYKLKQPVRTTPYRVRYEDELNQEQFEVVMAGDGPMLVIAGAGSGKTRALTYRVSRLIEDGVDPSDILLLTFTNKASREMLSRVENLVTVDTRRIWGGTFHSIGNRLLRQHAAAVGFRPNFSILDEEDAKEMMEASISSLGIATLEKRFPKGDVLIDIHSYLINTATSLELHLEQNFPHFLMFRDDILRVFAQYAIRKKDANVMDFDDLLVHWRTLLIEHPEAATALKAKFRHILVDEYQDTNRLQGEIVDLMASNRKNLTVVGDDAQSIYSFRGASFENILTFPQRFEGAKIFRLETNYRSTPEILELANQSIAQNRFQFPKELRSVRSKGQEPALVGVDDVFEQASFVAQRILELRDEGESLGDIAVLYRSHYQSLELQMELSRRNIPYEIRSGVRFFEQAHIKDVLSYLKIITNPRDELSWKRMLKLHPKVGEKIAHAIWERIRTDGNPLGAFLRADLNITARAAATSIRNIRSLLSKIGSDAMRRNPSEVIRLIVEESYGDYVRSKFPNAQARLDDLEQLSQYALRDGCVEEFLSELALASPLTGEDVAVVGPEDEKITLSSVHQAKGLEWRRVFLIWLSDGRFPSARALRVPGGVVKVPVTPADPSLALPMLASESEERPVEVIIPGEEEERRLFYVAVTRARDELYLVFPILARDRMQMEVLMEPSRFVRELPDTLYEKWVIE
jgi:DNA helicase II / ATP-dependent DNA helicase PcrA